MGNALCPTICLYRVNPGWWLGMEDSMGDALGAPANFRFGWLDALRGGAERNSSRVSRHFGVAVG